jgi:hypothetical protein
MLKVDSLHKYQVELINNNRYLNILKRRTRISGAYISDIFLEKKRSLLQIYIYIEIRDKCIICKLQFYEL